MGYMSWHSLSFNTTPTSETQFPLREAEDSTEHTCALGTLVVP